MSHGYFGIGIVAGKSPENLGGLWRSAHAFGASFVFTVGARYPRRDKLDTADSTRSVPLFEFVDVEDARASLPSVCSLVGVECPDDCAEPHRVRRLTGYRHPHNAAYLLGAEDRGLPHDIEGMCSAMVHVPTAICLNVATTGALVLYDRAAKALACHEDGDRRE